MTDTLQSEFCEVQTSQENVRDGGNSLSVPPFCDGGYDTAGSGSVDESGNRVNSEGSGAVFSPSATRRLLEAESLAAFSGASPYFQSDTPNSGYSGAQGQCEVMPSSNAGYGSIGGPGATSSMSAQHGPGVGQECGSPRSELFSAVEAVLFASFAGADVDGANGSELVTRSSAVRCLLSALEKTQLIEMLCQVYQSSPDAFGHLQHFVAQSSSFRRLLVRNISFTSRTADVVRCLSQYGEIEEASVVSDRQTGRSKGFAFVTFSNAVDASRAIADSYQEKIRLHGRNLFLKFAVDRVDQAMSWSGSGPSIHGSGAQHGSGPQYGSGFTSGAQSPGISRTPLTPAGSSSQQSQGLLQNQSVLQNQGVLPGQTPGSSGLLQGSPSRTLVDRPAMRKLFVYNLAGTTTSASLCDALKGFGPIDECAVATTPSGESRRYAFVTFRREQDAWSCLQDPNRLVDGRMVFIHLASEGAPAANFPGGSHVGPQHGPVGGQHGLGTAQGGLGGQGDHLASQREQSYGSGLGSSFPSLEMAPVLGQYGLHGGYGASGSGYGASSTPYGAAASGGYGIGFGSSLAGVGIAGTGGATPVSSASAKSSPRPASGSAAWQQQVQHLQLQGGSLGSTGSVPTRPGSATLRSAVPGPIKAGPHRLLVLPGGSTTPAGATTPGSGAHTAWGAGSQVMTGGQVLAGQGGMSMARGYAGGNLTRPSSAASTAGSLNTERQTSAVDRGTPIVDRGTPGSHQPPQPAGQTGTPSSEPPSLVSLLDCLTPATTERRLE